MNMEELKKVEVAVKLDLMKYSTCFQTDMKELFKQDTMKIQRRLQHGNYSKVSTFNQIYRDFAKAALLFHTPKGSLNHIMCFSDYLSGKHFLGLFKTIMQN